MQTDKRARFGLRSKSRKDNDTIEKRQSRGINLSQEKNKPSNMRLLSENKSVGNRNKSIETKIKMIESRNSIEKN